MKRYLKVFITSIVSALLLFTGVDKLSAASATISVSSNKSQVVVGDTVTVTVKVSSSELLGTWKWSLDYNSSKFKLTSGESPTVGYGDGKIKSKSYTYKFKAIATGSSSIGVKSAEVLSWSEKNLSISKNSKTIKTITQSEHQASLSKNNNLSSLSVEGLTLNPSFKSDITEYKVQANANAKSIKISAKVADSKANLSGTGTFNVSEGENKFVITVTAQNGSVKKYTVIVSVTDPNPINVTIDDEEYVIVKRESNLEAPEHYEKTTITINNQEVPAFYNNINKFTLVGLKNSEGDIIYFIYDKDNNRYIKYQEAALNNIKLYPLKMDITIENYFPATTVINDIKFESLKMFDSNYSIIHAMDLETGESDYYIYDSKNNSIIKYTDEFIKPYIAKIEKNKKLILILVAETVFIILILIGILISKAVQNKKKRQLLEKKKEEYRKKKSKKLEQIKESKK